MVDCGEVVQIGSAASVSDELERSEEQGKEAGGKARHRQHEREPAEVGVGALTTQNTSEAGEDERGGDDSGAEEEKAGAEKLAGVWLHKSDSGSRTTGLR